MTSITRALKSKFIIWATLYQILVSLSPRVEWQLQLPMRPSSFGPFWPETKRSFSTDWGHWGWVRDVHECGLKDSIRLIFKKYKTRLCERLFSKNWKSPRFAATHCKFYKSTLGMFEMFMMKIYAQIFWLKKIGTLLRSSVDFDRGTSHWVQMANLVTKWGSQ